MHLLYADLPLTYTSLIDPPCEENANGLFSNKKMQVDCNPETSAKYYANRPII